MRFLLKILPHACVVLSIAPLLGVLAIDLSCTRVSRSESLVLSLSPLLLAAKKGEAATADAAGGRKASASSSCTASNVGSEELRTTVLEATDMWLKSVTSNVPDAPRTTASLYAPDAVLWGTVSEELRDTPAEIRDYFNFFCNLRNLRVSDYRPCPRVFSDKFASNDGYYTFSWLDDSRALKTKHARFSFLYRKNSASQKWEIVDHHSSALPSSPNTLKHGVHYDNFHPR